MNLLHIMEAYNFLDGPPTGLRPLPQVTAVRDWVGHILLGRSMNIRASRTSTAQVQEQSASINGVPSTLFFNSHALQTVLPDVGSMLRVGVSIPICEQCIII
jgi:hypothetical protein